MITVLNENRYSRSQGSPLQSSGGPYTISEGFVCTETKNATTGAIEIRPMTAADVTASLVAAGLALEPSYAPSIAPTNGAPFTVGQGFDFTRYNRGGLIGTIQDALVVIDNNLVQTNSGVIVKANDTYVIDGKVYWDPTALQFTVTATSNVEVGIVKNYTGTNGSAVTSLTVKLNVFA